MLLSLLRDEGAGRVKTRLGSSSADLAISGARSHPPFIDRISRPGLRGVLKRARRGRIFPARGPWLLVPQAGSVVRESSDKPPRALRFHGPGGNAAGYVQPNTTLRRPAPARLGGVENARAAHIWWAIQVSTRATGNKLNAPIKASFAIHVTDQTGAQTLPPNYNPHKALAVRGC